MRPTTANRLIVINYSTCASEIIVVIIVQHGATVLNHTARDTLKYSTAAVDFSVIHATKTATIRRTIDTMQFNTQVELTLTVTDSIVIDLCSEN